MREIKFRIYDKELKEAHILELQDLCEDEIWYDGETEAWSVLEDCNNKQKRFVALQFTGLVDKNNYEIYEGDYIQYKVDGETLGKGIVKYSEKYAQYVLVGTGTVKDEFEPLCDYKDLEVIGNIYDNPDLLKGEENGEFLGL